LFNCGLFLADIKLDGIREKSVVDESGRKRRRVIFQAIPFEP